VKSRDQQMLSVLVIGGGNFMGSALLDVLLAHEGRFRVTVVSRDRRHWGERLSRRANVRHIKADRRDRYELLHALSSHADESDPWRFCVDFCCYDTDDCEPLGTFLAELQCHYVLISTDSIYEVCDTPIGVARLESHAVRPSDSVEQARLRRLDSYGDDKKRCEEWLASNASMLTWTSLRLPDVFGPRDYSKRHWSYQLLVKLQDERPVQLTAKERQRKLSFVYSLDVARAVLAVIERPADAANQCFNLACVETPTLEEYLQLVARALGKPSLRVEELADGVDNECQFLPSVSERAGVLDVSAAQRALAFSPTPLADAVAATVLWHERAWREHKDERPALEELDKRWHERLRQIYS